MMRHPADRFGYAVLAACVGYIAAKLGVAVIALVVA